MLLTRSPLRMVFSSMCKHTSVKYSSFDLHVLGMPPAFILSQDQTLHLTHMFLRLRVFVLFTFFRNFFGSKLTFPIQFSKSDFFASTLTSRQALIYNTKLFSSCQSFFYSFLSFFQFVFLRFPLSFWRSFILPNTIHYVNAFYSPFLSFFIFF